jgi:hypothetical protein
MNHILSTLNNSRIGNLGLVDFTNVPIDPITLDSISDIDHNTLSKIFFRYKVHGFSIVECKKEIDEIVVLKLAKLLDLGKVFVPPLYKRGLYKTNGVSTVKSTNTKNKNHKVFESEANIELHCDGTLQPIGFVQTTILACKHSALKGGESILFNATAAYYELFQNDREAALSMASDCSLIRQANLNNCGDKNIGPVFAIKNGELVCAYSVTQTDSFMASYNINIAALKRAIEFMHYSALPGSKYYYQHKLNSSQILIFANSKVSHGRLSYKDGSNSNRCMFRALFLEKVKEPRGKVFNKLIEIIKTEKDVLNLNNKRTIAWWQFRHKTKDLYQETYNHYNKLYKNGNKIKIIKGPIENCSGIKLNGVSQWLNSKEVILDTEESYTVAAWVRVDSDVVGEGLKFKQGEHAFTAISQDALTHSAFYLGIRAVENKISEGLLEQTIRWSFTVSPIDGSETESAEWQHACTQNPLDDSIMDKWFLLVGVCDAEARKISIYVVNTKESNTVSIPEELILLPTDRGIQIGKGKWLKRNVDFWPGSIGPIKLFSYALNEEEISHLSM